MKHYTKIISIVIFGAFTILLLFSKNHDNSLVYFFEKKSSKS